MVAKAQAQRLVPIVALTSLGPVLLLTFRSKGPWGLARRYHAKRCSIRRASPFRTAQGVSDFLDPSKPVPGGLPQYPQSASGGAPPCQDHRPKIHSKTNLKIAPPPNDPKWCQMDPQVEAQIRPKSGPNRAQINPQGGGRGGGLFD